jgi:hypothetical protein
MIGIKLVHINSKLLRIVITTDPDGLLVRFFVTTFLRNMITSAASGIAGIMQGGRVRT